MFAKSAVLVAGVFLGVGLVLGLTKLPYNSTSVPKNEAFANGAPAKAAKLAIETTSNAFTWDRIESADPAQLGANLRRIGCPEKTIQDILSARILFAYAEKAARLQNPMSKHWSSRETQAEQAKVLSEITEERNQLMTSLGIPVPLVPKPPAPVPTKTSQLSPEKQKLIADITSKYPNELLSITATPEEIQQRFQNRKARLDYLAQILTPEELTNYRLEQDSGIKSVETMLRVINPTPEELQKVAFAFDFCEASIQNGHFPPEAEQVLRDGLGEQRFAELLQAYSPENAGFSHFLMTVQPTPEEIAKLKDLQQQNLPSDQMRTAVTQLLGGYRASQYFHMTQRYTPITKQ